MSTTPPVEPADVFRLFGMSPLRAGIIRATVVRGAVTAQDLMEEFRVGRATLVPHTRALVDAGILVQELDPQRAGAKAGFNRLVWRVEPDVLSEYVSQLRRALEGAD